jgi:chorismate--pyruvate lyase
LKSRSQLFNLPPRWQQVHHGRVSRIPPPIIASWLFERGSLTERLRRLCGDSFHIVLLSQSWQKPYAEESRALKLRSGQRAVVREVALQSGDQPLVLARSVIPAKTLHGADRRLANLGTRPLGHVLFTDPRLRRLKLEVARIDADNWRARPSGASQDSHPIGQNLWGRRSLYSLGSGHILLVAEFFLPPLFLHEVDS